MSPPSVRTAVIPAAGFGTRFLPATKVTPKELIPLLDKPVIQFAVEEAVASGIEKVVIVLARHKTAVLDYFRSDPTLEQLLLASGKEKEVSVLRNLARLCHIEAVYQESPAGLGHAIACARKAVGDEPFVVLLPDVVILSSTPCAKQVIECSKHHRGCVIATRRVKAAQVHKFGILAVQALTQGKDGGQVLRVTGMVEKPDRDTAPSRFGIFGRYLLQPDIFDYLDSQCPDRDGEIQLTHALARYAADKPVYALCFAGEHFDVGDKLGFIQVTLELALRDPGLRRPILQFLKSRSADLPARHRKAELRVRKPYSSKD